MTTYSKPFLSILLTILVSNTLTHSLNVVQQCQPTESFFCQIKNYETVQPFNNTLGHATLEEARSSLHKYGFLKHIPECHRKVQLFLCSLFFPVCVSLPDNATKLPLMLPCKNICEEARECEPQIRNAMNSSWPPEWDCNNFQYYSENHKLCVIDNQEERAKDSDTSPHPTVTQPTFEVPYHPNTSPPILQFVPPSIAQDNKSLCDPGLFDCRSSDPKRPLCIDMKYYCDGKVDCFRADETDPSDGADEQNCPMHCKDKQLFCLEDSKCIDSYDICNGIVDCSTGIDEKDCIDNLTGLIQSILCIFVMMSAIYILVRFFRVVRDLEDKNLAYEATSRDEENLNNPIKVQDIITRKIYEQPAIIPHHPILDEPSLHDYRESFYQEPSILTTKSDAYERIIPGGYSGASSVYAFEPNFELSKSLTTPPAPPPTPSLDRSNSPFMRSNLYENMED